MYVTVQVQYSSAGAVPCFPDQRGPNHNHTQTPSRALIALALLPTSPILMTPVPRKEPRLSLYPFQMHTAQVLCKVSQNHDHRPQHLEGLG